MRRKTSANYFERMPEAELRFALRQMIRLLTVEQLCDVVEACTNFGEADDEARSDQYRSPI